MELLIVIGLTVLFGMLVLSTVAQKTPQPPQVVYIRAEQLDALRTPNGGGGVALLLFCLVVLVALVLF